MKIKLKKGFTLIELVIVIAVLGVLAGILVPTLSGLVGKATEANDKALATNLTTTLKASNKKITKLSEIKEVLDESLGEEVFSSLVPKSVTKGNHFWYNSKEGKVEVKTLDEIESRMSEDKFDESFRSCIKEGYVLLDQKGSELATMASLLESVYSRQECDAILQYFSSETNIASNFINNLQNTLIINENGCLRGSDADQIENIYFTSDNVNLKKTTFFEFSDGAITFKNTSLETPLAGAKMDGKTIKIKKSMFFGTQTLLFSPSSNVILDCDVEEVSELRSIFAAEATNALIRINNDDTLYKIDGSNIVKASNNEIALYNIAYTISPKKLNYEMVQVEATNVSETVEVSNNKVAQDVNISGENVSAYIPAGVKVENNTNTLELSITPKDASEANLTLGNFATTSIDVHIEGVSSNNDVPIIVNLGKVMNPNLKDSDVKMYHVENYESKEMTLVSSLEELVTHNTFYYNKEDGNVTMAVKSFSEYTISERTAKRWNGTYDYSWYNANPSATTFTINSAEQLAALAAIVNGDDGQNYSLSEEDRAFKGDTIELGCDIVINDWFLDNTEVEAGLKRETNDTEKGYIGTGTHSAIGMSTNYTNDAAFLGKQAGIFKEFPVIGKNTNNTFMGSFNGNNHSISGLFGLHYDESECQKYLGLFGIVEGKNGETDSRISIKNLTIKDSWYYYYHGNIGLVANSSYGKVDYENINIIGNYTSQYNWYSGGLVGYLYPHSDTYINNVCIDDSNKFEALWETYDSAVGGLVGEIGISKDYKPKITISDCDIFPKFNVYNDADSNYQWFQYRRCGMIIGYLWECSGCDISLEDYLKGAYLSCSNVKVHYGDWHNFYYYKSPANGKPSYAGVTDWKYRRYNSEDLEIDKEKGTVTVKETKKTEINGIINTAVTARGVTYPITEADVEIWCPLPFDQLFGGGNYYTGFFDPNTSEYAAIKEVDMADVGVNQNTSVITFDVDGQKTKILGNNEGTVDLETALDRPGYDGYKLYKWSDGSSLYEGTYSVSHDQTLTATWALKLSLRPDCWDKDGALFGIYALSAGDADALRIMMDLNEDLDLYEAYVPVDHLVKIDFLRINPSHTGTLSFSKDVVWNQTNDITDAASKVGATCSISGFNQNEHYWSYNVYLIPSSNWKADGARFAAYFWDSADDEKEKYWFSMATLSSHPNTYWASYPVDNGYDKVIFVRMNGATVDNNWGNKFYNQTQDLLIVKDGTCTITGDNEGTW